MKKKTISVEQFEPSTKMWREWILAEKTIGKAIGKHIKTWEHHRKSVLFKEPEIPSDVV